jgi:hypothetical protein
MWFAGQRVADRRFPAQEGAGEVRESVRDRRPRVAGCACVSGAESTRKWSDRSAFLAGANSGNPEGCTSAKMWEVDNGYAGGVPSSAGGLQNAWFSAG